MKTQGSAVWQGGLKVICCRSIQPAGRPLSVVSPIGDKFCNASKRCDVPCVDGSELARTFFTFAALVGAAMCSAFKCGTQGRWP